MRISDDIWHLVCAPEGPLPAEIKYGTISHRWTATTKRSILEHYTLTKLRSKHPLSDLPLDFQRAVLIARFLGIDFLWIDSLCIIQDSEEDWARESMPMHDVYRNSIRNIVIEPSADSSALDRFKQASIKEVEWVNLKWKQPWFGKRRVSYTIQRNDFGESGIHRTQLSARGWIFQDLMISPRILHVYDDQLFWECPTMSACESYHSGDLSFQGLKTKEEVVKIIRGVVWRRFPGDGSQWYEAWGEIV